MNRPIACAATYPQRVYRVADHLQPQVGEPLRTVVAETADAVAVAWVVFPGQAIGNHVHAQGTDVWTVISGQGRTSM